MMFITAFFKELHQKGPTGWSHINQNNSGMVCIFLLTMCCHFVYYLSLHLVIIPSAMGICITLDGVVGAPHVSEEVDFHQ